jgi:hypothetical protein
MVFALQVTRTGNLAAGAPSVPGSTQTSSLSYFHHDPLGCPSFLNFISSSPLPEFKLNS